MKINHYVCDICGDRFENGDGFKITVKYPIDERFKDTITKWHYREQRTLDLCVVCAVERLSLNGTETDKDADSE